MPLGNHDTNDGTLTTLTLNHEWRPFIGAAILRYVDSSITTLRFASDSDIDDYRNAANQLLNDLYD